MQISMLCTNKKVNVNNYKWPLFQIIQQNTAASIPAYHTDGTWWLLL